VLSLSQARPCQAVLPAVIAPLAEVRNVDPLAASHKPAAALGIPISSIRVSLF
jgi:hypothetical protein